MFSLYRQQPYELNEFDLFHNNGFMIGGKRIKKTVRVKIKVSFNLVGFLEK